jgi:hypothetical protein
VKHARPVVDAAAVTVAVVVAMAAGVAAMAVAVAATAAVAAAVDVATAAVANGAVDKFARKLCFGRAGSLAPPRICALTQVCVLDLYWRA